jgi:AcrR family transcriptional regulator
MEAVTIDAIAETMGFSESAIYRNFPANNRFFAN